MVHNTSWGVLKRGRAYPNTVSHLIFPDEELHTPRVDSNHPLLDVSARSDTRAATRRVSLITRSTLNRIVCPKRFRFNPSEIGLVFALHAFAYGLHLRRNKCVSVKTKLARSVLHAHIFSYALAFSLTLSLAVSFSCMYIWLYR